ncbi:hypothetical protein G6F43_012829 [Rhizopus delemar]|nr:hypothetical protein G6F43_012829 [Rhizopus delemar]
MSSAARLFLANNIRDTTSKLYNLAWIRWVKFCYQRRWQPCDYNPTQVLEFLVQHKHLSSSQLNIFRSAIQSVFRVIHPDEKPLSTVDSITNFFKAKRRTTVLSRDSLSQTEVWDVKVVTDYVLSWGLTENLTLHQLQLKTIVLLCLTTMGRPRGEIAQLRVKDVLVTAQGLSVFINQPKEGGNKVTHVGYQEEGLVELCPVQTYKRFMENTAYLRTGQEDPLFFAYLDHSHSTPRPVRPKTVANWLKDILKNSGVDTTVHKAYSFRSAAATKAVMTGTPTHIVKKFVNWSEKSDTFERYYFKPNDQHERNAQMTKKIFGSAEKSTTSVVEAEATTIVVGTTHNTHVAEAKTQDVVWSHPVWNFINSFF